MENGWWKAGISAGVACVMKRYLKAIYFDLRVLVNDISHVG